MPMKRYLYAAIFCLGWSIALAALCTGLLQGQESPRHIDFTQEVKGIDGKPIPYNPDGKLPAVLTLGDAAVNALETSIDEDRGLSGAVKFEHDELARKVYKHSDVVLTAEELATIKERVGKVYGAMIVGAVWRMLDPAVSKPVEKSK
jgi:hypothetical protein